MAFRVEIQPQAFDDLDRLADYIKARGSLRAAEKWFNGIIDEIASLKELPQRCPIAPESEELGQEVRVLFFGRRNRRYKVYFSITHQTPTTGLVSIFHIRHWAKQPLSNEELDELVDDVG
jgi:plasmid stabilization system protein ParE